MEEGLSFAVVRDALSLQRTDIRTVSSLTLAFLGDAVYSLIVRSAVAGEKNRSPKEFHRRMAELVNAKAQAKAAERLSSLLTEEEADVYRRGRNANPSTTAKHASVGEYRKATGVEALVGYLYLTDQTARLMELMRVCMGDVEENG